MRDIETISSYGAMKMALEALTKLNASPHLEDCEGAFDDEIAALRQAINAAEQREQAQRQWVGLTKKEFQEAVEGLEDLEDCWVAIEAKLRSKNET